MIQRKHLAWQTVVLTVVLLCGLTGCLKWRDDEFSPRQPDKVLFERGMSAVEDGRFDVVRMTLQTLINTYPDSEYADKAKLVLEDLPIAKCGETWLTPPQCDRGLTPPPSTN